MADGKDIKKRRFRGVSNVADYSLEEKVGEGTFGEVVRGTHRQSGSKVALKRIIVHNEAEGMPVTALREIKILKRLKHPSVVTLVEMAFKKGDYQKKARGQLYMVFPYLDHDLTGLLENPLVRLRPAQIKSYIQQLFQGLDYLHSSGILHRDMKASNLLVNNEGQLKIADFGLARTFSVEQPDAKFTNLVVTRWYRPPELLMGSQVYGPAVDVWGAGCIFGELLKRHPILPGSSDMDQLEKIFLLCGSPTLENWPEHRSLPLFDPATGSISSFSPIHYRALKTRFPYTNFDVATVDFLDSLLRLDPVERPSASTALRHRYFYTDPIPAEPCTEAFTPFPSSHELDARKAREAAAEIAKYSQSSSLRPHLPNHYDALPAIGTFIPPRELVREIPREPRSGDHDWDRREREEDRRRDRGDDRRWSPPRSGSRNGSYFRDRPRHGGPYDRPTQSRPSLYEPQSRPSRHERHT